MTQSGVPPPPTAPPPAGSVLVVDDDATTRALVCRWLKSAGFAYREASTGEEALSLVLASPEEFSAIVLDVMMPGLDGFEVLTRLKKESAASSIPIVFLTASASEADIVRGLEAGAIEYLLKPFSGAVLVAKLRAVQQRAITESALRKKLQYAEENATTDALTNLLNRRSFDERLVEMMAQCTRYREPLALLMLDIDRFKSINDEHGHPAGDVALRFVADRVRRVLRAGDLAFRYGGEEFAVLLRKCDSVGAVGVYDRLAEELRREPVPVGHGHARTVTLSAGVATMEEGNGWKGDELVARADAALYRAKREGRDRVVLDGPR